MYAAGSLYVHPVCAGVRRGQKRVSDLLELELFTVVLSHHIGAGNWIWLLWKNGQHSSMLSHRSLSAALIFNTQQIDLPLFLLEKFGFQINFCQVPEVSALVITNHKNTEYCIQYSISFLPTPSSFFPPLFSPESTPFLPLVRKEQASKR